MKQREVFLQSEGDAWLERNSRPTTDPGFPQSDLVLREIVALSPKLEAGTRILEIGCGDGARLAWLREHHRFECFGIDPSARAVKIAKERGVVAQQGTAENLHYADAQFDIVVFGFCLYLCDRDDLFRIAQEADRVLKSSAWLLILDFYSAVPFKRDYHHRPGLFSYKMDYRTLFTWHPAYTTFSHRLRHHSEDAYTDDPREWVATSVLRKNVERSL